MWWNHPELTQNCPVGLIPQAAKWFEEVRHCRTTQNSLETALFPLHHSGSRRSCGRGVVEPPPVLQEKGEKGLQGSFEEVRCGRTTPNPTL